MSTIIKDEAGVTMAGPDEPGLAAAKARDVGGEAEVARSTEYLRYCDEVRSKGRVPFNYERWANTRQPGTVVDRLETNNGPIENLGLTVRQIEKRDLARQQAEGVRAEATRRGLMSGSAGDISRDQAGILPTGPARVSDAMVQRAQEAGGNHGSPLGAGTVRAMLEAALRG